MNLLHLKQLEIINSLSFVPSEKLDEILRYLESIILNNSSVQKKSLSLWGAWENINFNISEWEKDLEIFLMQS